MLEFLKKLVHDIFNKIIILKNNYTQTKTDKNFTSETKKEQIEQKETPIEEVIKKETVDIENNESEEILLQKKGLMSAHFSINEMQCSCSREHISPPPINKILLEVLEELRTSFQKPIIVTSAYRCSEHNASIDGAKNSFHILGKAADIVIKTISPNIIYKYLDKKYPNSFGIGFYTSGFVHIDVRETKARWIRDENGYHSLSSTLILKHQLA
jgi:uncharacterized protein YcbK (DUF882 family)